VSAENSHTFLLPGQISDIHVHTLTTNKNDIIQDTQYGYIIDIIQRGYQCFAFLPQTHLESVCRWQAEPLLKESSLAWEPWLIS
jgi:hypothetical protein